VGSWTIVHVAQPDDTLALIAARYGSSVKEIVAASGLEDPDLIYLGQVLTVPVPSAEAALRSMPVLTGSLEGPTMTQEYALPAPTLLTPDEGSTASRLVTLRWRWDGQLGAGQFFALHLWRGDQPGPCCLYFVNGGEYTLGLGNHAPAVFHWSVRIIQGRQAGSLRILDRFLTPPGERFTVLWPGTGR
jgi:hypothetical protein